MEETTLETLQAKSFSKLCEEYPDIFLFLFPANKNWDFLSAETRKEYLIEEILERES